MSQPLNPRPPTPHGFVEYSKCARCGTERPKSGLFFVGEAPPVCVDEVWCSAQAKAAGRLEGL